MLKDITLGQYFPGNSIAHKLDPRTKILLVTLYIIALFSAKGWMGYAVMAVTLAACVKVSHVGLRALVRGLKPLVFIIAFTGILNMFFTPDTHYLWEWGILRVSVKGIENALFMVIRIMLLVMGTFLMTYTTSPVTLANDGYTYYCEASNAYGMGQSPIFTLRVAEAAVTPPQTGDSSHTGLWLALLLLSLGGLFAAGYAARRRYGR